uniref:Uncharacterized protein n=1 Tax=Picea sitchensis TaxID=3332 RepID=C0PSU8_PICSI|nr:unknown [Picea sitchensis]
MKCMQNTRIKDWKYWPSHAISLVKRNQVIMHRLQKRSALALKQSFLYLRRSKLMVVMQLLSTSS